MLLGADLVGVLDRAAQMKHGEHGQDHHHTLKQQGQLKLFPYPVRVKPKQLESGFVREDRFEKREETIQTVDKSVLFI